MGGGLFRVSGATAHPATKPMVLRTWREGFFHHGWRATYDGNILDGAALTAKGAKKLAALALIDLLAARDPESGFVPDGKGAE